VKPCLASSFAEVIPADPYESCLFLAELNLDISLIAGVPQLTPGSSIVIGESARRYLLDTQTIQMLQAHLLPNAVGFGWGSPAMPVRKRIVLPANAAQGRLGAGTGALLNRIPSMHFTAAGAGQVLFNLPIPDDINFNEGMQFRLVWGYQADTAIAFDWRVGAQFYAPGDAVSDVETVDIPIAEPASSQDSLLSTGFHDFNAALVLDASREFAVVEVTLVDTGGPLARVHLVQVEIEYTANSAGGII